MSAEIKAREAGQPLGQSPEVNVYLKQPPNSVESTPLIAIGSGQPADYLCMSLFNLFCCFWPLGIVALLKSLEVRSHFAAGRYQDALSASAAAKLLNTIGIIIGTIIMALVFMLTFCTVAISVALPLALSNYNATDTT